MIDYQKIVVSSLPPTKAFDLAIAYFGNLGFIVDERVSRAYIKFRRGSVLLADTGVWKSKKMFLTLRFSQMQSNVTSITCEYAFPIWIYEGKKDFQNAEVQGFQKYLELASRSNSKKRICPKCRREIPFDAKICPYCGYDFPALKNRLKLDKSIKKCPHCGKEIPGDAALCPYCGYSLTMGEN